MMNSNTLSPESSSTNQQGLAGQGKKGKSVAGQSKALFSSLLEALQKGKGGAGKKGETTANAEQTTTSSKVKGKVLTGTNQTTDTKGKLATQALLKEGEVATKEGKLKLSAEKAVNLAGLTNRELKAAKVNADENAIDVIAVAQETSLIPQQTLAVAKGSADQSDVLVLSKKQNKSQTQASTQQTSEAKQQLKDQASQAAKVSGLISPEQQSMQKASNSEVAPQLAGFDAKAADANKSVTKTMTPAQSISNANASADDNLQKGIAKTTGAEVVSRIETPETGTVRSDKTVKLGAQTTEQQIAQAQASAHGKDEGELKDSLKTGQSPAVALQQRSPNQNQTQNSNVSVSQNNTAISARMSEGGNTGSQQDMGPNQQDVDMSMMDANKADSKSMKTLDFQAQLAYKSQRAFTPADTMLEIVRSAKTGSTSLELQLEPANLGKVQVSIQMDAAKQIHVAFTVDQANSRQALEQQMPQLRLALAQQGLDLGGFSMQMNQQGGQQEQSASSHRSTSGTDSNTTTIAANEDDTTRMGVNLATNGRLNILA
ncbi:MAG: flagellar hook-length control protein FliK [Ghiorsea sp.]